MPTRLPSSAPFAFAAERHAGQVRKSGEPYVVHPLGVARICAELRAETPVIVAALLHDTVEDTETTLEEIAAEFGDDVALLVDGVTKLSRIHFDSREQAQAESYRKMVLSMARDVRVVIVKLADRLHNMRTLGPLAKQKQLQNARETLEVYAPIAHRLGIHQMKWELEDLAFTTLHPRRYAEIEALVSQRRADREEDVAEAARILDEALREVAISAEILGRAKHFYSIYQKMARGGKEFNEILDLTAMRVLVDSVKDCYGAIGVLHALWKPIPGRFKDYVAMPKSNGYQSLHTTVIGPKGQPLEIQVRTHAMHQTAEYGVAAHWIYKHRGEQRQLAWLRSRRRRRRPRRPGGVHGLADGRDVRRRGVRVHAAGRGQGAARAAPRRSTSPTPCTPTSATAASAPRSTGASCRCTRSSPRATSSRSSPRTASAARRATG